MTFFADIWFAGFVQTLNFQNIGAVVALVVKEG